MKKLIIRESDGRYHLENFGPSYSGVDGKAPFSLVIESKGRGIYLEFPQACLFDLFTRFDLHDPRFLGERFECTDFVRLIEEGDECVVEARSGTLYDFFKERLASGNCLLLGKKPVTFYWQGSAADAA